MNEFKGTSLVRRYFAYLMDTGLCWIIIGNLRALDLNETLLDILGPLLFFSYLVLEGTVFRGQSLGKALFKLRLVSTTANQLSVPQVLCRASVLVFQYGLFRIDSLSVSAAYVSGLISTVWVAAFLVFPLLHQQRRTLLDVFTKTAVIPKGLEKDSLQWVGADQKSLMKAGSAGVLLSVAFILVLRTFFSSFSDEVRNFPIYEIELSQALNHPVRLNFNIVYEGEGKASTSTLTATMRIKAKELSSVKPLMQRAYTLMRVLNPKPTPTHLRVVVAFTKTFYLFPVKAEYKGPFFRFTAVKPSELADQMKVCDEQQDGYSCTQAGHQLAAQAKVPEALEYSSRGCAQKDWLGCYNVACYLCRAGKNDEAFKAFSELLSSKAVSLSDQDFKSNVEKDPDLACVRKHPQYQSLLPK